MKEGGREERRKEQREGGRKGREGERGLPHFWVVFPFKMAEYIRAFT